ncbi:MAG TPA: bifunctional acetate--CoA ligase family protein/GNAT family N-acetyltransferase [Candidatus Acidoferrum sp.]|nr:bifunctional acetate--CoA ligase family protein/GNAT family N-acetyltransferase [Candidatus Acidoferrum sp.]
MTHSSSPTLPQVAELQPRGSILDRLFFPNSVAVVGATDRVHSVGRTVVCNLMNGSYKGRVYPVNPGRAELFGRRCYSRISEVPEAVDLVVVVTPASTVPEVVAECVKARSKGIVVISAGFKEKGPEGVALEKEIRSILRGSPTRLIGPNCLGLMNPAIGLNATFAEDIARSGNVAFLSQSGALLTAILDWSFVEQVGFSAIVSTGSMLDVGWGDLISFFGEDSKTESILVYMESIGDARDFLSAAREVAFSKPIIVIKPGRSEAASRAAASHTGALTGSDAVYDAAFRRSGVLRVQNIADIFHMAEALSKQPRPRGPRLMILTNAGGPGVLATDALIAAGAELATLSEPSRQALDEFLPPHWSHANPIDILGDADPERFARSLELAIRDPNCDGLLAILAPQGMTDPSQMAGQLKPYAKGSGKPLLASWMGGKSVSEGVKVLNASGIPTFSYPDTAARVFNSMWQYTYHLRGLYETPYATDDLAGLSTRRIKARALIDAVFTKGRTLLTEVESKQLLDVYGIPTVPTRLAKDEQEALRLAQELGFPVVLKVHSEAITHKTDVDGVKLNLTGAEQVREAYRAIQSSVAAKKGQGAFLGVSVQPMIRTQGYEVILGSSVDSQFGPVILFGSGGQLVEVYRDRALAVPPLNTTLAQRLMEQTRIYAALKGIRGRPAVDLKALETLLVRFSELVIEQPRIREIDINPLLASPEGLLALDARMVLFGREVQDDSLPRPAIRPYPSQYISRWTMKDGSKTLIRPIRPEDEPLMVEFHGTLSDSTVYLRYFHMQKLDSRIAHERLIRKCFVDYDREIALVAERTDRQTGKHELVGVGRLTRQPNFRDAELGILVTDRCQGTGLGTELLSRLIDTARKEKLDRVIAHILAENQAMLKLAKHFHFSLFRDEDPTALMAILDLTRGPSHEHVSRNAIDQ